MRDVLHYNAKFKENPIYDLLQRIKEKPFLYLGQPSITCLHAFLIGYISTQSEFGLPQTEQEREFEEFQGWIQKKYKITATQSWDKIILFYSPDERGAFDKFFDLLEEFQKWNNSESNKNRNIGEQKFYGYTPTNMEDLYELIQRIKAKPGMYLGRRSITCLHMILRGYSLARKDLGLPQTQQEREFEDFQEWIQKRFAIASGQFWARIILFYYVDERDAFDKFFELFEEFQNLLENNRLLQKFRDGEQELLNRDG